MNLAFTQPWWLALGLSAVLPLIVRHQQPMGYSWVALLPDDKPSHMLDWAIRGMTAAALLCIALGVAGPHSRERQIEKIGTGAHIVLLLDRSASMNENFAGRYLGGRSSETKGQIARNLLMEFVDARQSDLFSMVSFSTSPIYTLPLTQDREAIKAAIQAANTRGRGITNIASGLSMALTFFNDQPMTGSRIVLLVSDGAAKIDPGTQTQLRQWFYQNQVTLYWIYLRNQYSASLSVPPKNPNENTSPEYFLHEYFKGMDIPYYAYEAENPQALAQAITDIGQLESKPIRYFESIPRSDLSVYCYASAALLVFVLLLCKALEIDKWRQ